MYMYIHMCHLVFPPADVFVSVLVIGASMTPPYFTRELTNIQTEEGFAYNHTIHTLNALDPDPGLGVFSILDELMSASNIHKLYDCVLDKSV